MTIFFYLISLFDDISFCGKIYVASNEMEMLSLMESGQGSGRRLGEAYN
jgi:hypothetical protein